MYPPTRLANFNFILRLEEAFVIHANKFSKAFTEFGGFISSTLYTDIFIASYSCMAVFLQRVINQKRITKEVDCILQ
ncbi:MAG: hypothetical protein C4308_04595 [Chitinophagaceae bacterium]